MENSSFAARICNRLEGLLEAAGIGRKGSRRKAQGSWRKAQGARLKAQGSRLRAQVR